MTMLGGESARVHSQKYRPDIDGIRAIAVLLVVLSHAFPNFVPGGYVGVDIFFVISGFLISSIIVNDVKCDRFSFLSFYQRRINRILPAFLFVIIISFFLAWFIMFEGEFVRFSRHVLASLFFVENFMLSSEAGYFDVSSSSKPLLHLWSLAVEEQFYLYWPVFILLAFRRGVKLSSLFFGVLFFSFVCGFWLTFSDAEAAYYWPISRSWEFMVGALLALDRVQIFLAGIKVSRYFDILGFFLVFVSVLLLDDNSYFPGAWAILPALGCFFLISSGGKGWMGRKVLSFWPLVFLGTISYSFYLWHWPVLSFFYIVLGRLSFGEASFCVLIAFIFSVLTFNFIELPFRDKSCRFHRLKILSLFSVSICVSALLVVSGEWSSRLDGISIPSENEWSFLREKFPDSDRNGNGIYPIGKDRDKKILFIGDSHIAQYAVRINKVISNNASLPGVELAVGGGCIPIDYVFTENRSRSGCWKLRDKAFDFALNGDYEAIVIGGAWNWYFLTAGEYFIETDSGRKYLNKKDGRAVALSQLSERIGTLKKLGKRVFFLLDNPSSKEFEPTGKSTRIKISDNGFNPKQKVLVKEDQVRLHAELLSWARENEVDVIDPFSAVCRGRQCSRMTKNKVLLYKDRGHFNPDWVRDNASFIDLIFYDYLGSGGLL